MKYLFAGLLGLALLASPAMAKGKGKGKAGHECQCTECSHKDGKCDHHKDGKCDGKCDHKHGDAKDEHKHEH